MKNLSYKQFYNELKEKIKTNKCCVDISLYGFETGEHQPIIDFFDDSVDVITKEPINFVIKISEIKFNGLGNFVLYLDKRKVLSIYSNNNHYVITTKHLAIGIEFL